MVKIRNMRRKVNPNCIPRTKTLSSRPEEFVNVHFIPIHQTIVISKFNLGQYKKLGFQ